MLNKVLGVVCVLILVCVLFIGGAQPIAVGLFEAPMDKGVHMMYYALITFCLGRLLRLKPYLSFYIALSIGIADEIHQFYLPGRTPDVLDLLADTMGIILCTLFNYITRKPWANTLL